MDVAGALHRLPSDPSGPTAPADPPGKYSTTFPLTENPISEGGKWVNGETVGLDWSNASTTPGFAIGHETGADFTDATAVLQSMTWAPDPGKVTAVVSAPGAFIDNCSQEVELRLRTAISAHNIAGYEIDYGYSTDPTIGYMQVMGGTVRWAISTCFKPTTGHYGRQWRYRLSNMVETSLPRTKMGPSRAR